MPPSPSSPEPAAPQGRSRAAASAGGGEDEKLGRRDRHKQRTRERIVAAAFELADRRGFDAVTVEDITEAADVSRTTFFRYFAGKDAVLVDWMTGIGDRAALELGRRPHDETPVEALRNTILALTEEYAKDPKAQTLEVLRDRHPAVAGAYHRKVQYWEDALTAALAARAGLDPVTDLTPRLAARLAMAAITAATDTWRARGRTGDVRVLMDAALASLAAVEQQMASPDA